jgi:hypothetical protein
MPQQHNPLLFRWYLTKPPKKTIKDTLFMKFRRRNNK